MTDRIYGYQWSRDMQHRGTVINQRLDANIVGAEFQRIDRDIGPCTPLVLLDESRPSHAPLHPLFEWDDAKAAEKWRLTQARHVIMNLQVAPKEGDAPMPAAAYIVVGDDGDGNNKAHVSMLSVVDDPARRREFLLKELRAIEGDLRRTEAFPEMEPLREAAAEVRAALTDEGKEAAA